VIFISAGHYPSRPGAKWERFVEHDEAIIWQQLLCERLGDDAIEVPTGVLRDKVAYINERSMNGDAAIEIHFNAARDASDKPVGRGCESLYFPGSETGKHIARLCQDALALVFTPDRGVKEGWYRMDPKRGADFFLEKTKCPAVIIEPEFVHRSDLIIENRDLAIDLLADSLKGYMNGEF